VNETIYELSPPFFGGLFLSKKGYAMRAHLTLPEPIGKCPYFDKIQFWVCEPLDFDTLALLNSLCGPGGMHIDNRLARFNNTIGSINKGLSFASLWTRHYVCWRSVAMCWLRSTYRVRHPHAMYLRLHRTPPRRNSGTDQAHETETARFCLGRVAGSVISKTTVSLSLSP
jgi:hypothetical protein